MNNIKLVKANRDDLQTLVDGRLEFLLEFWGSQSKDAIDELKNHLEDYFKDALNNNTYVCFIAKSGDAFAGIGGMMLRVQPGNFKNPTGKVGYIMNMYTPPAFRRKGICSIILEKLIEEGSKNGINLFELHATKEGEQVYPKHGFEIHGEPTYRKYLSQLNKHSGIR